MGLIRWVCYITAAIASLFLMAAGALFTMAVGALTGILAVGGAIITMVAVIAIGIKESWESRNKH